MGNVSRARVTKKQEEMLGIKNTVLEMMNASDIPDTMPSVNQTQLRESVILKRYHQKLPKIKYKE